jgi:hypothetical protein
MSSEVAPQRSPEPPRRRRIVWTGKRIALVTMILTALAVPPAWWSLRHDSEPKSPAPPVMVDHQDPGGCTKDAVPVAHEEVFLPDGSHRLGTLQVMRSALCGVSWGRIALDKKPQPAIGFDISLSIKRSDGVVDKYSAHVKTTAVFTSALKHVGGTCVQASVSIGGMLRGPVKATSPCV